MSATSMLGALAQETRLEVVGLLVRQGPDGAPAGEIARTLGVPHSTMSSHLSILAHAGLVASRREGRSIIYRVDFEGTRALLAFLLEDCCQGRKDVCRPAVDAALAGCC
jgi:DNA-binding transcriptional ArsR family regulator